MELGGCLPGEGVEKGTLPGELHARKSMLHWAAQSALLWGLGGS